MHSASGDPLREALDHLDPRERQLLSLIYFAGHTQNQVAAKVGLSRRRVARTVQRALRTVGEHLEQDRTSSYAATD